MVMVAFACARQPLSFNATTRGAKRDAYREHLKREFASAGSGHELPRGACYGIVYYFLRGNGGPDADNISKPLWDALRGVAYEDDAAIRFRQAAVIDTDGTDLNELDLTHVPDETAARLIELLGDEDHVLYVEIGSLRPDMLTFGLAGRGA